MSLYKLWVTSNYCYITLKNINTVSTLSLEKNATKLLAMRKRSQQSGTDYN